MQKISSLTKIKGAFIHHHHSSNHNNQEMGTNGQKDLNQHVDVATPNSTQKRSSTQLNNATPLSKVQIPTSDVNNLDVFEQLKDIQKLLLEEQLLLTQEKHNIVDSVQSINSIKLNIPPLLSQIRKLNKKLKEITEIIPEQSDSSVLKEQSSLISNLMVNSPISADHAKQKIANVWSRLQSNYSFIGGQQSQQSTTSLTSSIISQVNLTSDDLWNRRFFKRDDKDHPLGEMKLYYENVVNFLRYQPILLAKTCKGIIKSQQRTSDTNQSSKNLHGSKESERLVDIIIYSMYGNNSNNLETRCILKFIKYSVEIAFENCQKPTDIMKNNFISHLLTEFFKRRGIEFFKFLINESLFELLQNDEFDVRLEQLPGPKLRRSSQSEMTPKKTRDAFPAYSASSDFEKPRSLDVIAKSNNPLEEREKKIRSNKINLYSICNKIMSCLSSNVDSVSLVVRAVLRYIMKYAHTKFPKVRDDQKLKLLKAIFFQLFLIPSILNPERTGANDIVLLPSLRNKLTTVIHVLSHVAAEKYFDEKSPFKGMNLFIEQNKTVIDKFIIQMIDRNNNSGNLNLNIFHRLGTSFSSKVVSKSLEKEKQRYDFSPMSLSTEDLKLLLQILIQSSFVKSPDVEKKVKDSLTNILNASVNPLQILPNEKFIIMGFKPINAQDYLPDDSPYTNNLKSNDIKYLLQQVLISVKHIESNIDRKESCTSIESILEDLYRREKLNDKMVTVTTIVELLRKLKSSDKKPKIYLAELREDIQSRVQYLNDIMDIHKKLLSDFDLHQEHVLTLANEKERLFILLENSRFLPFFQNLLLGEFMKEFRKCAFVEDQEKKLRIQYFKLKNELIQYAQRNYIPQSELENVFTQLMRILLRKVYRLLVSPKGSLFEKKDEAISSKCKKLAEFIKPAHLEIPSKYYSICDCKVVQEELLRLDIYALPRDKLSCITKFSSIIIELMRLTGDDAPSIDGFLPLLIFNIILANPPRLFSNLKYISRFDDLFMENKTNQLIYYESRDYTGEYWLRHLEAAILFLEGLDPTTLMSQNIEEPRQQHVVVSNNRLEVDRQFVKQSSRTLLTPTQTNQIKASDTHTATPITSPLQETDLILPSNESKKHSDKLMKRSSLSLTSPRGFFSGVSPLNYNNFRFVGTSVEDLKYSDIPSLFSEYMYAVSKLQQLAATLSTQMANLPDEGDADEQTKSIDLCTTEGSNDDFTFININMEERMDNLISDDEDLDRSPSFSRSLDEQSSRYMNRLGAPSPQGSPTSSPQRTLFFDDARRRRLRSNSEVSNQ